MMTLHQGPMPESIDDDLDAIEHVLRLLLPMPRSSRLRVTAYAREWAKTTPENRVADEEIEF